MKQTPVLFSQHIGRMIKFNWFMKGKIKVLPTPAENILKSHGYDVVDIKELLRPVKKTTSFRERVVAEELKQPCFIYGDSHLLIEGLEQAKVLTNTIEYQSLPEIVSGYESSLNMFKDIDSEVIKRVKLACMYDATQQKLPVRKDPLRPAWNFPRDYGITDVRKNELLCKNLVLLCHQYSDMQHKSIVYDLFFSTPFYAHNKNLQFEMTSDLVITTSRKLNRIVDPSLTHEIDLPNLYPICCTVSLLPTSNYELQDIYPFSLRSKYPFIQTAVVFFNETQVKNLHEKEVTESQILGRSLLKGFTLATAEARALFGNDVQQLPEPIVVPVVHTDGKMFHFSIFQLNTLELDKDSKTKNIFWHVPRIALYQFCGYIEGKPSLIEYNPEVIKKLLAFINIK